MSNQWLITIGINQYQHFQPLNYAQADAQGLWKFLVGRGGFLPERCLELTDTSPYIEGQSTYPCGENIKQWIDHICQQAVHPEDQVWFFFSGYGIKSDGVDYLMPIDGNPADVKATGIPLHNLFSKLKGSQASTTLVLLDMNHQQENQDGSTVVGSQTVELAREIEIPTILSSQPNQFSYEVGELQQGLFTAALLEGLRSGAGLTLASLKRYLSERVPELSQTYSRPLQEPVVVVNPPGKSHQVILPEQPAFVGATDGLLSNYNAEAVGADVAVGGGTATAVATPTSENPFQEALENQQQSTTTSVPAANNGQSGAVQAVTEDEQDEQDGGKFQKFMLWGGGLLLLLLLLVATFGRNYLFPAGEQTATSPGKQNKPGTATKPETETITVLERAYIVLQANSPSSYGEAIKQASKIKQGDPLYQKSQESIERWSRNILDIAQGRAKTGNYLGALAAAGLVPQDPQPIYTEAEKLIRQWSPLAKKQQANQVLLSTAKGSILPGQASTHVQAINIARKIPAGEPGYVQAQALIKQSSQGILNLAKVRAASGNYALAIQTANVIPKDLPAYAQAKSLIAEWEKLKK